MISCSIRSDIIGIAGATFMWRRIPAALIFSAVRYRASVLMAAGSSAFSRSGSKGVMVRCTRPLGSVEITSRSRRTSGLLVKIPTLFSPLLARISSDCLVSFSWKMD